MNQGNVLIGGRAGFNEVLGLCHPIPQDLFLRQFVFDRWKYVVAEIQIVLVRVN
jgi:hypothetical protein